MSSYRNVKTEYYVGDFETTTYEGQTETAVWSACWAHVWEGDPTIVGCIEDFMERIIRYKKNIVMYFHNLKFDGAFIFNYLLHAGYEWDNSKDWEMHPITYKALISDKNRYYSLTVRTKYFKTIEFRDSAKLLPFKLRDVAFAFNTTHKKLDIEYKGYRYPNCAISDEERAYILNDVLVLREAMREMLERGHNKLTIGACCMNEFKGMFDEFLWEGYFPNLKEFPCVVNLDMNTDAYVRKTYKGAWCYCKSPGKYGKGRTYDVNSLYPSVMHSDSGNYYPVGLPIYWTGNIPDTVLDDKNHFVWFVHLKCRFNIRKGFLPTIQIKRNLLYTPTEWLTTSDIRYKGKYYTEIVKDGKVYDNRPELYLTMMDYKLLLLHYHVTDLEVLDGCYFQGELGIFDQYINKWMERKENAKNKVDRTEAKLFQNNLYGKLATGDNSSYQIPRLNENDILTFELVEEFDKKVLSIDKGSMVTSYARYFTITHAQENYDLFIYADTDSLHMLEGEPCNIKVHPTHLLCWKLEKKWRSAIFIRQKTYAELPYEADGEKVYPKWEITCAGMPEKSKQIFLAEHPITDFKVGLKVRGKLVPKMIKGGLILVDSEFTLHGRNS